MLTEKAFMNTAAVSVASDPSDFYITINRLAHRLNGQWL